MKKRFFCIALVMVLSFIMLFFGACSIGPGDDDVRIVCTTFAQYDWVKNILVSVDGYDLILLNPNGVDLHNYQPSVEDIITIKNCDLFLFVGGESEKWVKDILEEDQNILYVNLIETLGERVKFIPHHHDEEDHSHDEHEAVDEHVWLSLKNAIFYVNHIAQTLMTLDEENSQTFLNNAQKYCESLERLDLQYEKVVQNGRVNTIVFSDRFPFRYLLEDYGIEYYAAFEGCSSETEVTPATIINLANVLDQLLLKYVFVTEEQNTDIAQSVINTTQSKNQKILTLDSMQSVTNVDIKNGVTYLGIMTDNLQLISQALRNAEV